MQLTRGKRLYGQRAKTRNASGLALGGQTGSPTNLLKVLLSTCEMDRKRLSARIVHRLSLFLKEVKTAEGAKTTHRLRQHQLDREQGHVGEGCGHDGSRGGCNDGHAARLRRGEGMERGMRGV